MKEPILEVAESLAENASSYDKQQPILESEIEKLDREIEEEIAKAKPNIEVMLQKMRTRRNRKAYELRDRSKRDSLNMEHLSSSSHTGKVLEQIFVKRFNAVHENQKERSKMQKTSQKLSIDKIYGRLSKDATSMYQMWKTER